jgi:hypothetical protein
MFKAPNSLAFGAGVVQPASPYRHAEGARHVCWLRWGRGWSCPRAGIGGEIKKLSHIRHGLVTLRERGKIEPRFNQLERRGVVHWSMRYEVLLGKRRDHYERHPETSQCKVPRLVCRRHDWRYAVRARDGDRRNVIVQTSTFIERFDQNGIFPRWAVHKSVDQFRREFRSQLDIALRVLINAAAAGPIYLDSSLYVRDLGQRPVLHVSKILAQGNHIRVMGVEVSEIREIGMSVGRIDFPGDMVVIHQLKNCHCRYLLSWRHDKPLRSGRHPVKAVWMRTRWSWRKPAVRSGEIRGHEIVKRQIAVVVKAHGAFAGKVRKIRQALHELIMGKFSLDESISVHGENAASRMKQVPYAVGLIP